VEPVRQPATPLTGTAPVLQPSPPSPPSLLSAPPLPPSPFPPTPLTAGQPGLSDAFPSRDYATKRTFSGSFSNRSYETMAVIRGSTTLRLNQEDLTFDLRILRGSPASSNNRVTLSSLLAPASGERNVMFEMLDRYCLEGQIRVGARIVEWAKATTTEGASRTDWEVLKNRAERDEKVSHASPVGLTRRSSFVTPNRVGPRWMHTTPSCSPRRPRSILVTYPLVIGARTTLAWPCSSSPYPSMRRLHQ
jgi:hypothetical protein